MNVFHKVENMYDVYNLWTLSIIWVYNNYEPYNKHREMPLKFKHHDKTNKLNILILWNFKLYYCYIL